MTGSDPEDDDTGIPEFLRKGWSTHQHNRVHLEVPRPRFLHDPDEVSHITSIQREIEMQPKYEDLNGQQLLEAYNAMVDESRTRKSKFPSKAHAVAACAAAWNEKHPATAAQVEVAKTKKTPADGTKTSRRLAMRIELTAQKNPRRGGTDAHKHWEAMKGRPSVSEYLDKFSPEDRRTAAQWLSNTIRDGHARVVNA